MDTWSFGVAAADITPATPQFLIGMGWRTERSKGVYLPLVASALYEVEGSSAYFQLPARFHPDIEDRIVNATRRLIARHAEASAGGPRVRRRRVGACTLLLALVGCLSSLADQLAWNERAVSERAAEAVRPGSLLVSYCSMCDDERVEVWRVRKTGLKPTDTGGLYEVTVDARRLLRSQRSFAHGEYHEPVSYEAVPEAAAGTAFPQDIDLAYVYVPSSASSFRCLGRALGLECQITVGTITLPPEALAAVAAAGADRPPSALRRFLRWLGLRR